MTLFEGTENQSYKVLEIQTHDEALKYRLLSFGITTDSQLLIERFSSNKSTLIIQVNHTSIALRDSEAQQVLIEPL